MNAHNRGDNEVVYQNYDIMITWNILVQFTDQ